MRIASRRPAAAATLVAVALLAVACTAAGGAESRHSSGLGPSASSPSATPSWARTAAAQVHKTGELLSRSIPGGTTHFAARNAEIYLPAAALNDSHLRLPVLELLHGTPGGPLDWLNPKGGRLLPTLEAFARTHGGRAPIVVMPDINGTHAADTECYETKSGANVEQYLGQIVPAWIAAHLPATTNHRDWAVAGLSEGGTCALMLGLRHRATFRTIGDYSGLAHPSVSDGDDYARTLRELFHGNKTAYNEHDPVWLMAHGASLAGVGMWLQSGAKDRYSVVDQAIVARDARAKGATVHTVLYPGLGHKWPVWANAIAKTLPWWWKRMSL